MDQPRWCSSCERWLTTTSFGVDNSQIDRRSIVCYDCVRERNRARYDQLEAKYAATVVAFKTAHGCLWCGWNEHPAGLHVDHIEEMDERSRARRYRSMRRWVFNENPTPSQIQQELELCQVLCANCHAIKTHEADVYRLKPQVGEVTVWDESRLF